MADEGLLLELFTCLHHMGELRITPTTCAGMWTRARRDHEDALVRLAPCVGCTTGAGHAGAKVMPAAPAQPASNGLACARCGGGNGRRLLGGRLCISCYNRQREYEAGRNARGGPPAHHRPLFCVVVGAVGDAGDVQPVRVGPVASPIEALLTVSRATGVTRFGRPRPGSTATPCPPVPRRPGVFALPPKPA